MRRVSDASNDLTVVAWADAGRRPAQRRSVARRTARGALALMLLTGLAAGAVGSTWLWQTGRLHPVTDDLRTRAEAASASQGLVIADIMLIGRELADRDAIGAALRAEPGAPILAFDPEAARARLLDVPWVREARVARRLPGTIVVTMQEFSPFAMWQRDGRFALIDREGAVILDAARHGEAALAPFTSLPQIVGAGAPVAAAPLIDKLAAFPELAVRLRAAVRVADRRWDLTLEPDILVRLPEDGWPEALAKLAALQGDKQLLDRAVAAIDMRLPDRLVLRPLDSGAKEGPA